MRIRRWGARKRDRAGFTLIELLVVVVILGVISGVVVFAVRGAGDKPRSNAVAADQRTVRTAQEAFCARYGRYAETMDELVNGPPPPEGKGGFLSEPSKYNDFTFHPGSGPCKGTYEFSKITGDDGPPVNPGSWTDPAQTRLPDGVDQRLVLLDGTGCEPHCGSVLRVVLLESLTGTWGTERWDPTTGLWTLIGGPPSSPPPSGEAGPIAVLNRPNCDPRCGDVLFQAAHHQGRWHLYDPHAGPTGAWTAPPGQPQYMRNHDSVHATVIDGTGCSPHCGKVLVAGGQHDYPLILESRDDTWRTAELYDPQTGLWERTGDTLAPHERLPGVVGLDDGSVLLVDAYTTPPEAERWFPGTGEWVSAGQIDPTAEATWSKPPQVVRLGDGRVLLSRPEKSFVYDPSGTGPPWTTAAGCNCPAGHLAVVLQDGHTVLRVHTGQTKAELFDTASGIVAPAASPGRQRNEWAQAVRLSDGRVMVVGGGGTPAGNATYEIFSWAGS